MAERPGALVAARIVIDAVEDAGILQIAVGSGEAAAQFLRSQFREGGEEGHPMGARMPICIHHLVAHPRQGLIAAEHALDRSLLECLAALLRPRHERSLPPTALCGRARHYA